MIIEIKVPPIFIFLKVLFIVPLGIVLYFVARYFGLPDWVAISLFFLSCFLIFIAAFLQNKLPLVLFKEDFFKVNDVFGQIFFEEKYENIKFISIEKEYLSFSSKKGKTYKVSVSLLGEEDISKMGSIIGELKEKYGFK